ncbi:MarR family transcriptional regulator [Modestobacter sp. I12A-02628]|uniref:MarR family transcriptional regulator n=1 Tax=Goekera deserti TaxID=2497753 RepID=A0A7K3W9C1_9ACTN|nr:MarR family transcriptional regulator [Goekera deserti]MPQ98636.1 MarR family transcriptional regulator [Goekera deserti]NDI49198.1 MarR family transcriptional regulator [Goekera deserti]NEL52936.1 MarR family transcriptional regulator [Goekera deserti]
MPTPQQPAGTPGDLLDRPAGTESLYRPLTRLLRVMHAVKAQLGGSAAPEVARERAAHNLLFPLAQSGPLRQGTLAELVHSDPSTVSRHVSLLVDKGLVRRVPDAQDGRASRLTTTPEGEALLAEITREREAFIARVTASWPTEDVTHFTELMNRFVDDLSDQLPTPAASGGPAQTAEKNR